MVGAMTQITIKVAEGNYAASPEVSIIDHAAQGAIISSASKSLSLDRDATTHLLSEYVTCSTLANGRETMWSMLEDCFFGSIYGLSSEYQDRHGPGFSGHDFRDDEVIGSLGEIVIGILAKELRYWEQLFADNGLRNGVRG